MRGLVLAGLIGLAAPAAAGPSMSSETNTLLRQSADAGGGTSSSASHTLQGAAGEQPTGISASANYVLQSGAFELFSFPSVSTGTAGLATLSSATLSWAAPFYDGERGVLQTGSSYYIRVASYTVPDTFSLAFANVVVSTSGVLPGASVSTTGITSLAPNTTWFASLWTVDARGDASFESSRATFTTLALPPRFLGPDALTFLEVAYTSVTVAWGALPFSPPAASSETSEGYVLEASSTNFGALAPGGIVSSTATFDARASTLTVFSPALVVDRDYYFRVGARNHRGELDYLVLGSTRTKIQANPPDVVAPAYLAVTSYSVTAQWGRNGNALTAYYRLESSLLSDFSVVGSSVETFNLQAEPGGLAANTTYFFQVRATTKTSVSGWTPLGSTVTLASPPATAASTFTAVGMNAMTVLWSRNGNPPDVSTYTVVLTTSPLAPQGNGGDVVLSTRPAGAFPAATATGLGANTTYYLYVDARNWLGASSGWIALGSTATLPAPPAAASPFVLETAYSSMTVSWSRNGNAVDVTTYTVVFTTGSSYPNALPGNVTMATAPLGGTISATATGLLQNATYSAFVRAEGHAGGSTAFVLVGSSATRAALPVAPPAPFMALSESSYRVFWSSGTEDPGFNWSGTTYYVQVATDATFWPVVAQAAPVGAIQADFASLSPNTTYAFRVAAFDVFHGTWTSFVPLGSTATLASLPASVDAPVVDKTSATVTWTSADPVGVTTFTVVLSPQTPYPNSDPGNVVAQKLASAIDSLAVTGLSPNTTYYPFVSARNRYGVETAYSVGSATVTKALEPAAPFVSTVYLSSLTVSWSAVSAEGYEVKASSAGGAVSFSSTSAAGATSLSATGLEPDTTYYLRLAAYNWNGHPTGLEISSAATLALPPAGPGFKAVYETSATLTWNAFAPSPSSASSYGYQVDAATADAFGAADFGGQLISSITYNVASATLTVQGLEPGATYAFRIGSLNPAGLPNYTLAGSTRTRVTPFTWVGGGGNTNWYNAANWSPRGVPSSGSPVTIALNNVSVTVSASSPSISFSSLTLGSPSGAARVNLFLSTSIARGGDILVYAGAGVVIDSTQTIRIDGDWTMMGGSSMTHTANNASPLSNGIDLSVTGTFDLRAGATIDVTTRGYSGGVTNGGTGQGPGGGAGSTANSAGGGGGGHGGTGGAAGADAGGPAYDSAIGPSDAGSGGGGGDFSSGANVGGAGGGYVRISAGIMKLDGSIVVDGGPGGPGAGGATARAAGGGGSAGAVALTAGGFSGAGSVSADGGGGGTDADAGDDPGGGGSGGIVGIDITGGGNVCSLTVTTNGGASGGGTSAAGGAGIYSSTRTLGLPGLSAAYVGSDTIKWTWTASLGAQAYRLFASTGGAGNSPSLGSGTLEYYERGLLPNTTYQRYLEATACGASRDSAVAAYSTLASTISALAQTFLQVDETFVKAAWRSEDSEGYVLEASTASDFTGDVASSTTYAGAASTLAVSGLDRNTTYYFRAASLNWQSVKSSYTALGSISTLALPPSVIAPPFLEVWFDSATLQWHRFYGFDPLPLTAEGFVLEASTTNFGALSPGGDIVSSATPNVALSTLTLSGLELSSTYYFRVGSLNHSGAVNYATLQRLVFLIEPSILSLNLGALDPSVVQSTVATTAFDIRNAGNVPVTLAVWASTATPGSEWALGTAPDVETPVLQGLFNTSMPPHAAFTTAITASTTTANGGVFAGDQSGVLIPAGQTRRVWFRLQLPTSTAAGTQDLRVEFRPLYP